MIIKSLEYLYDTEKDIRELLAIHQGIRKTMAEKFAEKLAAFEAQKAALAIEQRIFEDKCGELDAVISKLQNDLYPEYKGASYLVTFEMERA